MNLETLRTMWTEATPEKKVVIEQVANAFKINERFGSKEMGGNGFCYECFLEPARPDHYNCDKCAGKVPVGRVVRSLEQIKASLKEKVSKNSKKVDEAILEKNVNEVFGV